MKSPQQKELRVAIALKYPMLCEFCDVSTLPCTSPCKRQLEQADKIISLLADSGLGWYHEEVDKDDAYIIDDTLYTPTRYNVEFIPIVKEEVE